MRGAGLTHSGAGPFRLSQDNSAGRGGKERAAFAQSGVVVRVKNGQSTSRNLAVLQIGPRGRNEAHLAKKPVPPAPYHRPRFDADA
jgi:hypothetical protein